MIFVHVTGALPIRLECECLRQRLRVSGCGYGYLETTTLRNNVSVSGAITVTKRDGATTQYLKTGTFVTGADVLTQLG